MLNRSVPGSESRTGISYDLRSESHGSGYKVTVTVRVEISDFSNVIVDIFAFV